MTWKRMEYETWDEAFRGLIPAVRQQSVRVASYTQVIFMQACAEGFGTEIPGGADRMRSQYGDLAYKCGLYHQLGKALVPPEYQLWQSDFTEEEKAVYQKYTTDGRSLVDSLQERSERARGKRRGELINPTTENIPWLMIRESCEQHMERRDGSGYPVGISGDMISPIAQIVGIAKELDRLSAEVKSEHPFDDAYAALTEQGGTLWSEKLIDVLKNARPKCRAVYNKFIHYTMTLPKTIPLVEKNKERPMGLTYRPMVGDKEGRIVAYEATPWFGAIANRPGETESIPDVHEMLVHTGLIADMAFYFLYEAADTVHRMDNCKIDSMGIVLEMLPGFYSLGTQLQRFNQLFQDQPIEKSKLILTVPEEVFLKANKASKELMARYLRNGVALMLDGFHPDTTSINELIELGFHHIRLAPDLHVKQESAALIAELRDLGFTVLGGYADSYDSLAWLMACGVSAASGTMAGVPVTEDELIRDCLLRGM